jgi:hypothetical protein
MANTSDDLNTGGKSQPTLKSTLLKTLFSFLPFLEPAHDHAASRGWPKWAVLVVGLGLGCYLGYRISNGNTNKVIKAGEQTNSFLNGKIDLLNEQMNNVIRERDKYETQLIFWQALPGGMVSIVSNLAMNYSSEPSNRAQIINMLSDITNKIAASAGYEPRFDLYVNGNMLLPDNGTNSISLPDDRNIVLYAINSSQRTAKDVSFVFMANIQDSYFVPEPHDGWRNQGIAQYGSGQLQRTTNETAKAVTSENPVAPGSIFSASFSISTNLTEDTISGSISVFAADSQRFEFPLIIRISQTNGAPL